MGILQLIYAGIFVILIKTKGRLKRRKIILMSFYSIGIIGNILLVAIFIYARLFVPPFSPEGVPVNELEVNGMVAGGRLRMSWTFSRARMSRTEIETVAGRYMDELRAIVEHCAEEQSGGFTPSDFAEFDFSQEELDDITDVIGKAKGRA